MPQLQKITLPNLNLPNGESHGIQLTYQLFGQPLNSAPVILVNHALTGNSSVSGANGWWNNLIDHEATIDLNLFTVVAFDVPGNGFQQEIVPFSVDYRLWNTKWVAEVFWLALEQLGVQELFAVIGGSIGGSIAWEMAFLKPNAIQNLIPIACSWKSSDWLVANVVVQSSILENSKNPIEDARKHAMLLYRTPESFQKKFNGKFNSTQNQFEVESWLNHHGTALKNRFSLDSYKIMNHLLKTIGQDLSEVDLIEFAKKSTTNIHIIAIDSDYMFTKKEQFVCYELMKEHKENIQYSEIQSIHGHDAFLIEYEQLNQILKQNF